MRKISILFATTLFLILISTVSYASFYYEIPDQKETLTVNQDGTILLQKEFSFYVTANSTEKGTEVWVGLPTDKTRVLSASYTLHGQSYTPGYKFEENDDGQFVSFTNFPAISPGETGIFTFTARIPDLVYWLDKSQPNKESTEQLVSISYIPAWWEKGVVRNLDIVMNFPQNLYPGELRYSGNRPEITSNGNSVNLNWSFTNIPQNEKRKLAVILPRNYFTAGFSPEQDWMPNSVKVILIVIFLVIIVGITFLILYVAKNIRYQTPVAYMKGDKAYTTFDPVETALFFNLSTDFVCKLIIMGLVKKRVLKFENNSFTRSTTLEKLTWYEELFLDSVDQHVEIIPDKWKDNYATMISNFYEMIQGYCGQQTMSYYTNHLKKESFTDTDDPRWIILQEQLAKGAFEKPQKQQLINASTPAYLHSYLPLFYLTMVNSSMVKENNKQYSNVFPGTSGSGGNSGPGCACACACACASSGGCT